MIARGCAIDQGPQRTTHINASWKTTRNSLQAIKRSGVLWEHTSDVTTDLTEEHMLCFADGTLVTGDGQKWVWNVELGNRWVAAPGQNIAKPTPVTLAYVLAAIERDANEAIEDCADACLARLTKLAATLSPMAALTEFDNTLSVNSNVG